MPSSQSGQRDDVDVAAERPHDGGDLVGGGTDDDGDAGAPAGVQQADGALDEGRLVRVAADERLGAAHPSPGAGREDEPADVRRPPVHGSRGGGSGSRQDVTHTGEPIVRLSR